MCSCSVSSRSLLGGLATLFLIGVVGSDADLITPNPPQVSTSIVDGQKNSILVPVNQAQPNRPTSPDCFMYFPGTPGWNGCFRKFTHDMAEFQAKMHEYVKAQAQLEGVSNGDPNNIRISPDQYSSSSYLGANSMSTSNSYTGGYAIHAVNMAMSTSVVNNQVKVILHTGIIDKFDTKTNGNEISIYVISKGQRKWAKILVPKGVKLSDVKVDRTSDSVYLTGPSFASDSGSFQMSQSESTGNGFSTVSFNQHLGPNGPMMSIPSVPMSDFQNTFQNMFQNFFTNLFGGRSIIPNGRDNYPSSQYYSAPQMWFY